MAKYKVFDANGVWLGDIPAETEQEALELAKSTLGAEASHVEIAPNVLVERTVR